MGSSEEGVLTTSRAFHPAREEDSSVQGRNVMTTGCGMDLTQHFVRATKSNARN